MKASWTQGQEPERVKDIRADFKSSTVTRKRLIEILEGKVESARTSSRNETKYDSPNWPYIQAGLIERERAYLEVISLLKDEN